MELFGHQKRANPKAHDFSAAPSLDTLTTDELYELNTGVPAPQSGDILERLAKVAMNTGPTPLLLTD
jgi:hypothetical protein